MAGRELRTVERAARLEQQARKQLELAIADELRSALGGDDEQASADLAARVWRQSLSPPSSVSMM